MTFPSNKETALMRIKEYATHFNIHIEEIAALLLKTEEKMPAQQQTESIFGKILSYLGGLLIFSGIAVYTNIVWDQLTPFLRVFITLGPGIISMLLTILCLKDEKYSKAVIPLLLIAVIMQTGGLFVFLHEYFQPSGNQALAIGAVLLFIAAQQTLFFKIFKQTAMLLFAVLYAATGLTFIMGWIEIDYKLTGLCISISGLLMTAWINKTPHKIIAPWLFVLFGMNLTSSIFLITSDLTSSSLLIITAGALYALTLFSFIKTAQSPRHNIITIGTISYLCYIANTLNIYGVNENTAALLTGLSGIAIGYSLQNNLHIKASRYLYFIFGVLASWAVYDLTRNSAFDIAMIGFAAAFMYFSIVIVSRVLLTVSVFSLLGYLAYFTNTYFANMVGWPIAMIFFGLLLIIISAYAMKIGRNMAKPALTGS